MQKAEPKLYGLLAEFSSAEAVLVAADKVRDAGYEAVNAYSPFPVHGLDEKIGFARPKLPVLVFLGGLFGAVAGFGMQYFASVIHYPLNVGGRPLNSWPAFIPITFECTVLFAALAAVFGMILQNGLPKPYHPVFNVEAFKRASQDRFFICIKQTDARFDETKTRGFLEGIGANSVYEVEP